MSKLAESQQDIQDAIRKAADSGAADKAKGQTKQVVGKVKEKLGSLLGDDELQAQGALQRAEGRKDQIKGEIKEAIEEVKDRVKAGVEVVREAIDDARRRQP